MADDDDTGMGDKALSLEGFFAMNPTLPEEERRHAAEAARTQLEAAVADEESYWVRLSSAVMMHDAADVSAVDDQFKEFATHWTRTGHGLNVITDFASFVQNRNDRFDRKQAKKQVRAQRAIARNAAIAAAAPAAPPPPSAARGGRGGAAAPARARAPDPTDMFDPITVAMPFDPSVLLTVLDMIEEPIGTIEGICQRVPEMEGSDKTMLAQGYSHMMDTFREPRLKRKYGYNVSDHKQKPLLIGEDVPSYFANVSDGSIYRRKMLSMAGLRNLILYGATLYSQLRTHHFSGDPSKYTDGSGLTLMRQKTGNVVDLDTVVLRCDGPTLNAINASNRHKGEGLPIYPNGEVFGSSPQAQEIAVHCAVPLLTDFAKIAGLTTKAQLQARHIDPESIARPIHVATSNTDRGTHAVWQYKNAGQNSFHVNVPNMDDVNGALLKAPLHCLRHWLAIHLLYQGDDLQRWVDAFFEDCIVDSCFNGKWKAIEEFGHKLDKQGTIVDVLQRLQAQNQAIFTMAFFEADDDDHTREKAEMRRLAVGVPAIESKSKKRRTITAEDVDAWVDDPSIAI